MACDTFDLSVEDLTSCSADGDCAPGDCLAMHDIAHYLVGERAGQTIERKCRCPEGYTADLHTRLQGCQQICKLKESELQQFACSVGCQLSLYPNDGFQGTLPLVGDHELAVDNCADLVLPSLHFFRIY